MSREEKLNKKLYYRDGSKFRCNDTGEVLFQYNIARAMMSFMVHN